MIHTAFFFFDHWLWHPLVGRGYQFWSGIAGCFVSLGLLTGLVAGWRHVNCHARGCLRLGKYAVEGTPYKTCAKHHPRVPDGGASAEHIEDLHDARRLYAVGKIDVDELEKRVEALLRGADSR